MAEAYQPGEERLDREDMLALHEALQAVSTALRRDGCGFWAIKGSRGHITSWGDRKSFLLYVDSRSPKKWTWDKRALPFCEVTQDGDGDGCLRHHGLPTPEQAEAIRSTLGIWKRPAHTPEHLQALRERVHRLQSLREPSHSGT